MRECVCVRVCVYTWVYCLHVCRSWERPEEGVRSPGTELQVARNCLVLTLGNELRPSVKAVLPLALTPCLQHQEHNFLVI